MSQSETGKYAAHVMRVYAANAIVVLLIAALVSLSAVYAKRSGVASPLLALDVEPSAQAHEFDDYSPLSMFIEEVPTSSVTAETPEPGRETVDLEIRYFDGRPARPARTIWMTVTAYSPDHRSCGKWADGYTASMKSVWTNAMKLVAADPKVLPIGSMVSVPGYSNSEIVPVLDVGGAIKGARLDVLYPSHTIARRWGVKKLPVTVWEYVDE